MLYREINILSCHNPDPIQIFKENVSSNLNLWSNLLQLKRNKRSVLSSFPQTDPKTKRKNTFSPKRSLPFFTFLHFWKCSEFNYRAFLQVFARAHTLSKQCYQVIFTFFSKKAIDMFSFLQNFQKQQNNLTWNPFPLLFACTEHLLSAKSENWLWA